MKVDYSKRPTNLDMKMVKKGTDEYDYYQSNYEEVRLPDAVYLGECETESEAWDLLKKYLEDNGKRCPYYYRCNYFGNLIEIDYGSWTHFAYIYDLPEDKKELIKLNKEIFSSYIEE